MSQKIKIFVVFLLDVIISYISSPYFGRLYEKIIQHNVTSWWGSCPECSEGFLIVFPFLAGLLFFGIFDKNRLNITLPFVLAPALLLLFARQGDAFLISLAGGLIGLASGQFIFWLRRKMNKRQI